MAYKGVAKGNIVILEEGVSLPDGMRVIVNVEQMEQEEVTPEEIEERRAVVARMKEFGKRLTRRHINLGDLILEGKEELEDRA
ncbi:MAG TPA: hypothetical protein VLB01_03585 [Thermodesulfobacteriota bacterium]|nr:hypothetical protein [Thermodesulfobacteriota bacterium]